MKQDTVIVESYQYDANGNRILETNTLRGIAGMVYDYTNEDQIITVGNDLYVF
ncbi:MAG: hypothetical protein GY775_03970, partial [Candidatus Scalindua sp.]|nr:hypothetical protein [Candidatus Scalindua sp.]